MPFSVGEIIHVPKYLFKDGTEKETGKFLVILTITEKQTVLVNLTTTQKVELFENSTGGCYQIDGHRIGFHFRKGEPIFTNGSFFQKDTYLIPTGQILEHPINYLTTKYPDISSKGILKKELFIEVLYCLIKTGFVSKRNVLLLEKQLDELMNE